MKAVNVDDVLKILYRYGRYIFVTDDRKYSDMVYEISNIKELKQEPKTGHWDIGYSFPDGAYWKCSCCGKLIKVKFPMNYCNNCGAKMEREE